MGKFNYRIKTKIEFDSKSCTKEWNNSICKAVWCPDIQWHNDWSSRHKLQPDCNSENERDFVQICLQAKHDREARLDDWKSDSIEQTCSRERQVREVKPLLQLPHDRRFERSKIPQNEHNSRSPSNEASLLQYLWVLKIFYILLNISSEFMKELTENFNVFKEFDVFNFDKMKKYFDKIEKLSKTDDKEKR